MKLNNKLIVITGGTSGIGFQIAKYLHSNNRVIVISRDADRLNNLSKELDGVFTYQADLSRLEDVEAIAYEIVARFKSIDVLINNAAIQNTPTFLDDDFQYKTISQEITINFTSICSLTYLLLPALLHRDKAVILNINSGLALAPKTTSAIYCASKGALNIFTQSLRYQLEQTNISLQQVFLELVDTTMTLGRGTQKMSPEQAAKQIIKGVERDIQEHDIGKVRLLRLLLRLSPVIARKIMKKY